MWVVISKTINNQNLKQLFLFLLLIVSSAMLSAQAAPIGGQVTVGTGNISQSGNTTTIHQQSQNLSLSWNKFDIAPKETVNFAQPGSHAIAVNRVLGSNQASQIQGHLNANGQVWLINPNGVVFGKNSTVNVGGLLASTLDIADSELNKSQRQFSGSGTGSIINKGNIQAVKGGYVAMIANTVSNQGRITTPQGTTALAAGSQVTVTFAENQLTGIRVDKSTLNNLVENKQIIRTNGGTVIMTAGAHDSLLSSAVNNSGIVEAQTLSQHKGNIVLLGGMKAGSTTVSGKLDASAPNGGKGGSVETSAAQVKISPEAKITTKSSQGMAGTWTIDPQDYTIAASGGDITGSQLSNLLASNNIIISSDQGQAAGNGDLNVNNAISWSNTNSLTLNAVRNVNFNSGGTVSNAAGGKLYVRADSGATGTGTVVMGGGSINMGGTGGVISFYYNPTTFGTPSTFSNVTAGAGTTITNYMLVNTPTNLAAITSNPTKNYALGTNINLSAISNFTPISSFSGVFDGLNNTINNLKITGTNNNVGLFSAIAAAGIVKNFTLSGVNVSGGSTVGALAGANNGTVSNISVSGTVTSPGTPTGGVGSTVGGVFGNTYAGSSGNCIRSSVNVSGTGINDTSDSIGGFAGQITGGTYTNVTVTGNVTAGQHNRYIGGVAGYSNGTITQSSFTGTITTPLAGYTGGFVGSTGASAVIRGAYSTANVSAGDTTLYNSNGGFVGWNRGTIDSSYSTGDVVIGQGWYGGGFVGYNVNNISNSYSTGNFNLTLGAGLASASLRYYGGLVGFNKAGTLSNDYATGSVTVTGSFPSTAGDTGGLVGHMEGGAISRSYASGNVTIVGASGNFSFGGLVGYSASTVPMSNVYASGNVVVGIIPIVVDIIPSEVPNVGGLVGSLGGGTLTNGYSVGQVSASGGTVSQGGLIGLSTGTISGRSFWNTATSGQATSAGGANAVGMSTANMQTQANFTSATAANGNVNPNWNFSGVWSMGAGSYLYPVFNPPNAPVVTPGASCPTPVVSYYPLTFPNISASNKVYDGTRAATVTGTLSGVFPGDIVSVSSLSGIFNNKNVGTAKPVTVTQPTLSGANAGKYLLAPVSLNNLTANITPLGITVTAAGMNKVYNGTTNAIVTLASSGVISGDNVNFAYNAANFSTKNVGNGKTVTVNGISASGTDAGNYTYSTTASTTANITPLGITVTAAGMNKVYNGTTNAIVTLASSGVISGDNVNFAYNAANFSTKNVGNGKTVTVNGISASGTDAGNYTYSTTASTTANITPLGITVTATGENKVYDGTTNATVTLASSGVIAGDTVSFSDTAANFSTKNVGNNIPITVTGISASGTAAGNYTLSNTTANTAANITPLGVTVTATGENKVYDGTTNATVTLASSGVIAGDTVSFSDTAANFSTKNVGNNIPITVTGISASGTAAGNYTLSNTTANTAANITPLGITVTATGENKVYDGTTNATVTLASSGVIAGDTVSFSDTAANFSTKNVGNNIPITVTGISASGTAAGNYTLSNTTANTAANITPLGITVTATGENKVYDGTTNATVVLTSNGVIAGDNVNFDYSAANFATPNVGNSIPITVTGITASGTSVGNYTLNNTTANTMANITPLGVMEITVTATGENKVYDGTTNATVTLASSDVIAGDNVNFDYSAANFATPNVGNSIPITVTGITASGTDAGNYSIGNTTANTTANITPLGITVTAAGMNKVYDGTTNATVTLASSGVIAGDTVSFGDTAANFSTKDVGNNIPITVTGISASGTDAGNYSIGNTTANTSANIIPLEITVAAVGTNKVYDGTTNAAVTLASTGVIAGDSVSFSNTAANFSTKNVGTNIPITVTGISANGASAGNYSIVDTTTNTAANITPLGITVTAAGMNKVYDGTTNATVTLGSGGVIANDNLNFAYSAANFATPNVGTNISITVSGITVTGSDAGNYSLSNNTANTMANITPLGITVTATGTNKVYDGTTTETVVINSSGLLSGDSVSFTDVANFNNKNVGSNKPVTVSGITAVGTDGGNYTVLNPITNTTADITPLGITVTAVGTNKVYDGTTNATVTLASSGVLAGDTVNVNDSAANFATKNVGNNIPITVTGISASGADAGNYTFNTTANTTANITPLGITVTATGANKVYDGTTDATVTLASSGVIAGDSVSFTDVANFNNKDVGSNKLVTINDITAVGLDGMNYIVVNVSDTAQANITPREIIVTATGGNKIYDGTTDATVILGSAGLVSGDVVTLSYGSAEFVSTGPGLNIPITVTGITVSGADAGNYTIEGIDITSVANIYPEGYVPPTSPLVQLYEDNFYVLQGIAAALDQPLMEDNEPITELNLQVLNGGVQGPSPNSLLVTGLNLQVLRGGVNVPSSNSLLGAV